MKKILIIIVSLFSSISLICMESFAQGTPKKSLHSQGLKNFYTALVAAERAQQQKSVLPGSKSHESLYHFESFDNGSFLVSGPTSLTYPLFNVVVTTEVTQDIVREVRAIFRPDKIPHTFIVDAGDMQGQEPLQEARYKPGGSYIEMVVDVSEALLPNGISPFLSVEQVQTVTEKAKDEDKVLREQQCIDWAQCMIESPGFSIKWTDLLRGYDSFYTLIKNPELLLCVQKLPFFEGYRYVKGALSSYLADDLQIILALSAGDKPDSEVIQKMVYESLIATREVNEKAKAVYLGTKEEFAILKELGFKKLRDVFIYTKYVTK